MNSARRALRRLARAPPIRHTRHVDSESAPSAGIPAKRFRIAFSFAGEVRDFIGKVAGLLESRLGKGTILFDRARQVEISRVDAALYLPDLFVKESDLVVLVASEGYDASNWCGLELLKINDLFLARKYETVLPCRFGKATLAQLPAGCIYFPLDGKSADEVAEAILQRLAKIEGRPEDFYRKPVPSAPAPLTTAIPNNLPRLQPFFGRDTELAEIARALHPDSRTWGTLIEGEGGLGKTALAVRAAYDCPPEHFERIVFVSLKQRVQEEHRQRELGEFAVSSWLQMLGEIARWLGLSDIPKAPETERARLLQESLAGRRVLLLLDNLETLTDPEQDKLFTSLEFLPAGCKALLTSREFAGSRLLSLGLQKLDQPSALRMLEEIAQHSPAFASSGEPERIVLYQETNGNALLLRWVAGQVGRGACRNLTEALAHLRTCPPGNDPLAFIFADVVATLTPEEIRLLAALTHPAQPIPVDALAQIARVPSAQAPALLKALANRALATASSADREFAIVPMVAAFLRHERPAAVAKTARRLQARAYRLIKQNGYKKHDRFPVLDAAWPTVSPALPLFLAGPNPRLQTLCDALQFFLNFTGRWDERLTLSQQAEAKALAAGNHLDAGWRAYQAGWVYRLRQQAEPLLACADCAAKHWERAHAGDRERAIAIHLRGFGHHLIGNYPDAIAAYQEVLELHRTRAQESIDVAIALNSLASAERLSGDYVGAERDYREALRVARAADYAEGVAYCTSNLAQLALDQGDWLGAEALAREALPLSKGVGRQESIAADCRHLAQALVRQGKAVEALPHARRAVEIYTRLGSPGLKGALATLAECRAGLLRGLRPGWTYNTTTLEGNTLTEAEVAAALADPDAKIANRPQEEVAAARAQAAANLKVAEWLGENRAFTKEDLFALHTILMQGSTVDSLKPIGTWKIEDNGTQVRVDGKSRWNDNYAAARQVPALMETWLAEFNRRREGAGDPFEDYLWLHATFARIHPFADGNGRLARLLANVPLVSSRATIVDIPATARDEYLAALARWEFASGPPLPNAPLYPNAEELAGFIALCRASLKTLAN